LQDINRIRTSNRWRYKANLPATRKTKRDTCKHVPHFGGQMLGEFSPRRPRDQEATVSPGLATSTSFDEHKARYKHGSQSGIPIRQSYVRPLPVMPDQNPFGKAQPLVHSAKARHKAFPSGTSHSVAGPYPTEPTITPLPNQLHGRTKQVPNHLTAGPPPHSLPPVHTYCRTTPTTGPNSMPNDLRRTR
jgi:hypothetical protein